MITNRQKLLHTFAALADLGQEIANTSDFEEMLRASFHLLLGSLAIRRGAVAEFDQKQRFLRFIAARGLSESMGGRLMLSREDESRMAGLGASGLAVSDATGEAQRFLATHKSNFETGEIDLLVPLVVRKQLIGVILLGEKASGECFRADDLEVICALSRHIGVGIHSHQLLEEIERKGNENRQLYEGLRAIHKDTVRAFANAIDIKDRYTQGHSVRVGKYSEVIAREMGWADDEVEGIAIAGYLHDIGKLVVDLSIINSPHRFTAKESKELSRHPTAGYEILAPIRHPYADIPLMARHHHERLDGHGYPDGLKGDEIPAGAKIVTLADSFDAMTTDRPYRKRLPLQDVVADFRVNTGKQFAPEVVSALCRVFLKEINGEVEERQIIRLLSKNYENIERVGPLLTELLGELNGNDLAPAAAIC